MWRVVQPLHQGGKSVLEQIHLTSHQVLPTDPLADRCDVRLPHA